MNDFSMMSTSGSLGNSVDPAAIAAAESAKARIQSAYLMAMHRPRSYDQARVKILEACRRPDFADKVEYSKPIWNSKKGANDYIVGPSIRFAELALREWGNVLYENQMVFEDDAVRRIRVTVIDLQTNTTFGKEVQLTKTVERKNKKDRDVLGERLNSYGETVYLVKATEDELLTREAALISKALRNEGLRLIPQEIIEEATVVARETAKSRDAKDPDTAKKKLVDAFVSVGVSPVDLEQYLQHPLAQCQPAELQELRKMYTALKDGEAKWMDFAKKGEDDNPDADKGQQLAEAIKGKKKNQTKENISPVADGVNDFPLPEPTVTGPANLVPIDPEMLPLDMPVSTPQTMVKPPSPTTGLVNLALDDVPVEHQGMMKPFSESEKLREQLRGTLAESEAWCEEHFKKSFKQLTKDDLRSAISKINAELDAREI
jgi:hypothetical protein